MLTNTAKFNADTDTSIENLVCSAWVIFAERHICLCMSMCVRNGGGHGDFVGGT